MKRKGRKSKSGEKVSNGVANKVEENGNASERDEQELEEPEEKRKKANKRKSSSKKADDGSEEEAQYEVEQILNVKNIRGVKHYLIRWKGYEPESDTWEPESTLNCPELITDFNNKQKKNKAKGALGKRGRKKKHDDAPEETWDENEDFEVDRILDVYFRKDGKREFLVSWKGYPSSQNSWEPEDNMDCKDLIQKYMEKVDRAKMSDIKELRIKRQHPERLTYLFKVSGRRHSKRNEGKERINYHDADY